MLAFLQNWLPINASEHGPALDEMTALVHWLMLVLFVGWALYFIYVLFRFRAGANPRASYEGAKSHISQYVEVGVAVFEVVLLVFFAIPAWASWVEPPEDPDAALVVRVVAEQFAWNAHYPGPDGVFGRTDINLLSPTNTVGLDRSDPYGVDDVVSVNQLHLPVDRDITIMLSSKDVIHSFALQQMRVKQDAVPGLVIPVHFKATMVTPEESQFPACNADKTCWEIACAQLCGLGHYRMKGYYTVHSQQGFDAWMADQVAAVMPAAPAEAEEPAE
jgi:cytochrome c oxidase subunit 2